MSLPENTQNWIDTANRLYDEHVPIEPPVNVEALTKIVDILMRDTEARGWEQPGRLYDLTGDPAEPVVTFQTELDDPVELVQELIMTGVVPSERVLGVIVVCEAHAWHAEGVTFDEEGNVVDAPRENAIELRLLNVMFNNEAFGFTMQKRGEEPDLLAFGPPIGRIPEALNVLMKAGKAMDAYMKEHPEMDGRDD